MFKLNLQVDQTSNRKNIVDNLNNSRCIIFHNEPLSFNKSIFIKNIKFLATQNDMKLGEFEFKAGVSPGYLSRQIKSADSVSSWIDLLIYASQCFKISIDTLLKIDFSEFSPNELYLNRFFEKLFHDTQNNSISWTLETKDMLEQSQSTHPQMTAHNNYADYKSPFHPDNILGTASINTPIDGGYILYIVSIRHLSDFNEDNGFDVFVFNTSTSSTDPLISVIKNSSLLYDTIDQLFQEASKPKHQIKLSSDIRKAIDLYLGNNLPF